MPAPLVCGLCGAEFVLLVVMRQLGVADSITFTLIGVLITSLSFWLNSLLKKKNINYPHQLKLIIFVIFVITIIGYMFGGV